MLLRAVRAAFLAIGDVVLRWAVPRRVVGTLPPRGCVLASNHPNYIDGPLAMTLDRHRVRPVAKPNPALVARLGYALGGTIVTGGDVMAPAVAHLRAGGIVWIAPEGQLNRGPSLLPPRTGAARLAAAASVPIVPLAIVGTRDIRLRAWRPWRRPAATLVLAEPLTVPADADPAAVMDEVMRRLAAALAKAEAPR